jgi:hypothetical protein
MHTAVVLLTATQFGQHNIAAELSVCTCVLVHSEAEIVLGLHMLLLLGQPATCKPVTDIETIQACMSVS